MEWDGYLVQIPSVYQDMHGKHTIYFHMFSINFFEVPYFLRESKLTGYAFSSYVIFVGCQGWKQDYQKAKSYATLQNRRMKTPEQVHMERCGSDSKVLILFWMDYCPQKANLCFVFFPWFIWDCSGHPENLPFFEPKKRWISQVNFCFL